MQINFTALILDAKGKPIPEAGVSIEDLIRKLGADASFTLAEVRLKMMGGDADKNTTLATISETALLQTFPGDQEMPANKKVELYKLFNKLVDGDYDWPVEDIATLKERINKGYGALAVGRAFDIIEGSKAGPLDAAAGAPAEKRKSKH